MQIVTKGGSKSPTFYIDDIQWEQVGVPAEFVVEPTPGTIFKATRFRQVLADNISSTVADGTMSGISYDAFMGLPSLGNGVLASLTINGFTFGFPVHQISDFYSSGAEIVSTISDGVNTMIVIDSVVPSPIVLDSRTGDHATQTISDNLSGLVLFQSFLLGIEVAVP